MATESTSSDYSTWSVDRLIARVTDLETRLRQATSANNQHLPSRSKRPAPPTRPFDPTRYSTRLIALKFAYLGQCYNGYEYHANNKTPLPTIEETMWHALRKTRLIFPTGEGVPEEEVDWTGTEYSKCGRTDRGVSAFGQVIGVRVRSNRPLEKISRHATRKDKGRRDDGDSDGDSTTDKDTRTQKPFDHIKDELPYIQLLNRVLPADIRVYAWCPEPGPDFSARFSCRERRYKYFFTNPAFSPMPAGAMTPGQHDDSDSQPASGWLDIPAMQTAAKSLEGVHDFRNFCKIDPAKQITNFTRHIFSARIDAVHPAAGDSMSYVQPNSLSPPSSDPQTLPQLYTFTVAGSAFLWHQVRHLVAILFLVGQGLEPPSLVSDLLDVTKTPSRPKYEMASDAPLVLWNCAFPAAGAEGDAARMDGLQWVYVGDEAGGTEHICRKAAKSALPVPDAKFGAAGIMTDLWASWHRRKIEEVLAGSLANVVALRGRTTSLDEERGAGSAGASEFRSVRVFDGSGRPRFAGRYVSVMQKERIEHHEVLNARYAQRKGLVGTAYPETGP